MNWTQEQIAQIRQSFLDLIPETEDLSRQFYERMFLEHPEVRRHFKPDMESQQDKLMDTLAALLDMAEQPERVSETLSQLGRRHSTYGATPEMYGWITQTLPAMIAERLGERCPTETKGLWAELMDEAGKTMMAGEDES